MLAPVWHMIIVRFSCPSTSNHTRMAGIGPSELALKAAMGVSWMKKNSRMTKVTLEMIGMWKDFQYETNAAGSQKWNEVGFENVRNESIARISCDEITQ